MPLNISHYLVPNSDLKNFDVSLWCITFMYNFSGCLKKSPHHQVSLNVTLTDDFSVRILSDISSSISLIHLIPAYLVLVF